MVSRGLFIVFEGGDGVGKSTQAARAAGYLRAAGRRVCLTREPAGTPVGALVKSVFERAAAAGPPAVPPEVELFLFLAARADHVRSVIRPALERGEDVVCDRFADSTTAYQGYGRGLPLAEVERLNALATGGLTPDLTVLLDAPPAVALARADPAGKPADAIGGAPAEFHERVREGFLALARRDPRRYLVVDAARPADAVFDAIRSRLDALVAAGSP